MKKDNASRISRSKLELFLECPRCFWLDRVRGVSRPDGAIFSLNLAVDALLKKEFDAYRLAKKPHPVMIKYGVDAIPFAHPDLATWRNSFKGIECAHASGITLFGGVDDVWIDDNGALIVVDYKATSTTAPITMEGEHRQRYKRQLETYQWLLRQNGFSVSDTGYLLYANADRNKESFDGALKFSLQLVTCPCDASWVDDAVTGAAECLESVHAPAQTKDCEWCGYRELTKQNGA